MNRNMMRQAQKQLAQLQKIQEELEDLTVEGTAGGGAVKVVMTGKQIVESVTTGRPEDERGHRRHEHPGIDLESATPKHGEHHDDRFFSRRAWTPVVL